MATTKTTMPRKRTTKTAATRTSRTTTATPRATSAKADTSLVARTGRTIKERPYTSAAIATGAVTVVAAAAAGAFLMSRRDKSFKEASEELTTKVKDGFASASETVKDGFADATERVKDLGQRGSDYFKGDGSDVGNEIRSQQQIAEEALTLKATGAARSPVDELSATEIKTGTVAY